jgi:hypothetical protein
LTGIIVIVQLVLVSATKTAAAFAPALGPHDGVIMITGIGDHLRPEWPITITGIRTAYPDPTPKPCLPLVASSASSEFSSKSICSPRMPRRRENQAGCPKYRSLSHSRRLRRQSR